MNLLEWTSALAEVFCCPLAGFDFDFDRAGLLGLSASCPTIADVGDCTDRTAFRALTRSLAQRGTGFALVMACWGLACAEPADSQAPGQPKLAEIRCPELPLAGQLVARSQAKPCPVELWQDGETLTLSSSRGDAQRQVLARGQAPNACAGGSEGGCRVEWQIEFESEGAYSVWAEEYYGGAWESAPRQLWFGHPLTDQGLAFVALWPGQGEYDYATPTGPAHVLAPLRCESGLFFQPQERQSSRHIRPSAHFDLGWWYGAPPASKGQNNAKVADQSEERWPKVALLRADQGGGEDYLVMARDALAGQSCARLNQP